MKSAIVLLSLLGCDDGATKCTPIQASNMSFASHEACLRASERFFKADMQAKYPMVLAKCDVITPTQIASRPASRPSGSLSIAAHDAVVVRFDGANTQDQDLFRLTARKVRASVTTPVINTAGQIADRAVLAAQWVGDKSKAAIDVFNRF